MDSVAQEKDERIHHQIITREKKPFKESVMLD
jgi:hypothetical protein